MTRDVREIIACAILGVAYLPIAEQVREHHKENVWPPPEGSEINACWASAQAAAALSALSAAGLVICPEEPTKAMIDAGDDVAGSLAISHDYSAQGTWEAMIRAMLSSRKDAGT